MLCFPVRDMRKVKRRKRAIRGCSCGWEKRIQQKFSFTSKQELLGLKNRVNKSTDNN